MASVPVPAYPVVFINCRTAPFVADIIRRLKLDESRTRRVLHPLIGRRVYLAETGNGPSMVRCSAVIRSVIEVRSRETWDALRSVHRVPVGNAYDWNDKTTVKYLYRLYDVRTVRPFHPPEGFRHGRIYMTYDD